MKTQPIFLLAAMMIFLGVWGVRGDENTDHAALSLIRTNYMAAVNSGDLSKIKNDLSKTVTGVMVTGEPVAGYDDLVAYWKKIQNLIGPGGSYHVTVDVDKTDLFGDIAVSHGTTKETVQLPGGKELAFNSFWTAVCHKEAGIWKVIRMQATMDPIDNVFVGVQLQKAKWIYAMGGIGCGMLLLIVIWFLSALRSRNRNTDKKEV